MGGAMHGVQPVVLATLSVNRQCLRRLADIDQVEQFGELGAGVTTAVQVRGQQRRVLRRAGVVKGQAALYVLRAAQPKQRAAGAQLQQITKLVARPGDLTWCWLDQRVGQDRPHQGPVFAVVLLGWQAGGKVVVGVGPVKPVEPVTGIEAVAVQRLGT